MRLPALDLALVHDGLPLGQLLALGLECLVQLVQVLLIGLQLGELAQLGSELPSLRHHFCQLVLERILHLLLALPAILLELPMQGHVLLVPYSHFDLRALQLLLYQFDLLHHVYNGPNATLVLTAG